MEARLSNVRCTDQTDLRGTFCANYMRRPTAVGPFLGPRQLFPELLDTGLDIGLQVLRTLVFRDGTEHLLQAVKALTRFPCLTVFHLGLFVFRADVGRHFYFTCYI